MDSVQMDKLSPSERAIFAIGKAREGKPIIVRSGRKSILDAVLRAIYEPSEAMIKAGSSGGDWPHSRETWQNMLNALIQEYAND